LKLFFQSTAKSRNLFCWRASAFIVSQCFGRLFVSLGHFSAISKTTTATNPFSRFTKLPLFIELSPAVQNRCIVFWSVSLFFPLVECQNVSEGSKHKSSAREIKLAPSPAFSRNETNQNRPLFTNKQPSR
jgi:hypothetical protein